jgi:rod shape-determining protein MreB
VKITIGTARLTEGLRSMEVRGRDLVGGIPRTLEIKSDEVREALAEPIQAIVEAVRIALERTPPELAADIVDRGIVLVGGGSLLSNLDILLREETGLPIMLAEDPFSAVVLGAGRCLEDPALFSQVTCRSDAGRPHPVPKRAGSPDRPILSVRLAARLPGPRHGKRCSSSWAGTAYS